MAPDAVKLREFDLHEFPAYPQGPLAEGKARYSVTGPEGGHRGSLLLSPEEKAAMLEAFAAWREGR